MRPRLLAVTVLGVLLGLAWQGRAQDDGARDVIERGIRALGGAERIEKYQAGRIKTKGKLEILGGIDSTQDTAYQLPDKFRQQMEMQIMGNNVTVVTVFDGKKGAVEVNGKKLPVQDNIVDAIKEGVYQMQVGRLLPLRSKEFEVSGLGEAQINGQPALGIRVVKKGHPDVNMFFDKKSGLPVKTEFRTRDVTSGQEYTEERIVTEYQTIDGAPVAKRVEILRDGKRFMDAEVVDAKFLERIDDSEFAVP
jgi:hypothetical protein